MEYSDPYLAEFLPREDPPPPYVPPEVEGEISSWIEGAGERAGLVARSARWTYAMFREFRLGQVLVDAAFSLALDRISTLSIGLFDRRAEMP